MKVPSHKGFTLVEIMIVLAIMGIMAAIAMPNYRTYMAQRRLNGAVRQVYGDLMAARQRAISENRTIGVVFGSDNHGYTIFADTDGDGSADGGETVLQTRDIYPAYYDVWVDGQGLLVDFYTNGTSRNPVINFGFTGQTTTLRHISVSTAGRIKINTDE